MITIHPSSSRRFTFIHRLIFFAYVASLLAGATVLGANAAEASFDLPADVLEKSVKRFAAQSGLEVLIPSDALTDVRTREVHGEMTSRQALDAMFAGTGLTVLQDPKTGAFAVRKETSGPNGQRAAQTTESDRPSLQKAAPIHAQNNPNSGSITGRVFNPVSGEYVRSAEVRIEGTDRIALTESDGSFQFRDVRAGETTVSVTYTGYRTARETFNVTAGESAVRDFNLTSTAMDKDSTLRMQKFVVSSEREGSAKAIMEQRRNMNISASVASDMFGDMAEGNVVEFMKFLPGVDIESVEPETRGARLGGMDVQYTGVMIDGVKLAAADAFASYGATDNGATGSQVRAVGAENMSLNTVESIEISRTLSPDMDADAPAGTINVKTKRAFDRKGRYFGWQLSGTVNSDKFSLRRSWGPNDDEKSYKVRPNYILDYRDVFFDQRLGIALNISKYGAYAEQNQIQMTYNNTPVGADQRPLVLTSLRFKNGPKFIDRSAVTFAADLKATSRLTLSMTAMFSGYEDDPHSRFVTFSAASNNSNVNTGRQTVSGDGLTNFQTNGVAANTARSVTISAQHAGKFVRGLTLAPKFEYKAGDRLTIDGSTSYSRSKNTYEAIATGAIQAGTVNPVVADWRATRSDADSWKWTITQLSGPDWSNLANFKNPRIGDEGRFAFTEIYNGELNAKYILPFQMPVFLKFGGKWNEENRKTENRTPLYTWQYVGPGGGPTGSFAGYPTENVFDMGTTGGLNVSNVPAMFDRNTLAATYKAHPEYFVNNATADNYYNAIFANKRDFRQHVTAAYGMGNLRIGKWQFQGGLRWERTETISKEWNPKTAPEVLAAGFPVSTARRASTIPGLEYQYRSNPQVKRVGVYDNLFPSLSGKYNISPRLVVQLGYSHAISRPAIDSLSGVWSINDVSEVISLPNPALKPELSDNIAARLAYYFEPVGSFSITATQNEISNLAISRGFTSEEFGNTNPAYADYTFITVSNSERMVRFRGLEFGYSQSLSFLPQPFRGTHIDLAYSRAYADERRPGMTPKKFSANVGWNYWRVNLRLGAVWRDATPYSPTLGRFRLEETKYDLSGGVRLSRTTSLFFQGRNIFNAPDLIHDSDLVNGGPSALYRMEEYGARWVFGVKGDF